MKTSKLRVSLHLLALSSMLAVWSCATQGDSSSPADAGADTGVASDGGNADVSQDGGNIEDAPPPSCDGESDCAAHPKDCSDKTLCAANIAIDPSARLLGLWASAPNDVWAGGTMGLVLHHDGSAWKTIPTGRLETLRSVAGTASNDVWFASTDRFLLHTRGVSADGGAAWDVYDSSAADTPHLMQSIWGNAEQGMWGLIDNSYGPNGLVLHSSGWEAGVGPAWTLDLAPTYMDPPGPFGGRSLFGFGSTDVWSGWVGGQLYRRVGGKWKELNSITQETLNGIWGTSADNLWFVGTHGTVRHWNGQVMSTLEIEPALRDYALFGVWGSGPNDLWIVGENALVLHYDGQHFARVSVGGLQGRRPALRKVWVSDTTDQIWIVGDGILLGGKKGASQ